MFNLELSIAAWRTEMLAVGLAPEAVTELEGHLRDDIEQQMRSGISEEAAFNNSVRRIGSPRGLRNEFTKMNHKNVLMYWPHAVLWLLAAFFVGLNVWVGEGLNVFAPIYCVLLSLNLALMAGPQPADPSVLQPRFRLVLQGQILIGLGAAAVHFLPLHPLIGLIFTVFASAFFTYRLRQLRPAYV